MAARVALITAVECSSVHHARKASFSPMKPSRANYAQKIVHFALMMAVRDKLARRVSKDLVLMRRKVVPIAQSRQQQMTAVFATKMNVLNAREASISTIDKHQTHATDVVKSLLIATLVNLSTVNLNVSLVILI